MPSPDDTDRPREAVAVARRYLRRERPLSALVVLVVVSLFLATYATTTLFPALAVAAVLLVGARAPVLRPHGTARLRSDDDPETVRAAFEGPTPPVLAFQWGVADAVTTAEETTTYTVSYLFGLRSVDVTVRTETGTTADGDARVKLEVVTGGRPWATYVATVRDGGGGTVVDVEYNSERRFGLRRVPQQLVATRYRDAALEAQGYTVVERDSHLR